MINGWTAAFIEKTFTYFWWPILILEPILRSKVLCRRELQCQFCQQFSDQTIFPHHKRETRHINSLQSSETKVWDWFSCTNTHTHSLSRITPRSICHTRQCQDVWILIPINYARRKYIRITVRGHKHTQGVVWGGMMIYTVIKVIKTIESINSTDNHI